MTPSFDSAVSSLYCTEDNNDIFDGSDHYGAVMEEFGARCHRRNDRNTYQNQSFDGADGLPLQSDECLASMIEKECQHLPSADYLKRLRNGDLDLGVRKEAVDWIGKVHAYFGFGPLCGYLSINYLDRFLSAYELPKGKAWMMQLLAVACLSIAAKMEETEVPLSLDLQVGDSKFIFEARTVRRMELLVLNTLRWRMQAVTPFSFIDYFLHKVNGDQTPLRSLILRSSHMILSTMRGIDFLEFRPSEIAAAVAVSVARETPTVETEKAFYLLHQHVEKERVLKCIKLMHDLSLISGYVMSASGSVPQSPIGVLDAAACLSYKSDDTTVGSCANSSHNSPDPKRRKLNRTWEVEG